MAMKDVCTVPCFLQPLMGKPSIDNVEGLCAICKTPATDKHHIVKRSQGKWVRGGVEIPKPTVRLCGSGNTSGCHGLAHQMRLHFRWVDAFDARSTHTTALTRNAPGSGHWEYKIFDEPINVLEAWAHTEGWTRL